MGKACVSGKQSAAPKKVKKKSKWLARVFILAGLVLLLGLGYIGAKYLWNNEYRNNQVAPTSFYFTVDMLGDTVTQESLSRSFDIYGGGDKELTFTVQNYFDNERINAEDITYEVSLSDESDYDEGILKFGETVITDSNRSQTITGGNKTDHEYTLVVPEGYQDGNMVKVQVASTAPYTKSMTLVFVLHDYNTPVSYRMEDSEGSNYATLYLMFNADVAAGNVRIDWIAFSEELFVDMTSPYILDEDQTLTTNHPDGDTLTDAIITKDMEEDASILIYFFKADPSKNYSTFPIGEDLAAEKKGTTHRVSLGTTHLVDTGWYDENEDEFVLMDAGDLYGLAQLANAGNTFVGKTVKLGADIKINTGNADNYKVREPYYDWSPIGATTENRFQGTFDGDMHTISGLYMNRTELRSGLFGMTESATIKNLKVKNSYMASSKQYLGALVGHGGATFENVYVDAIVEGADAFTGGFVGTVEFSSSTFENCWFDGTVINTCGQGKNERGFVGGFVGYALNIREVEFRNCLFTGFIDISEMDVRGSAATGGFVGVASGITLEMHNSVMLGGIKPGVDGGYYAYLGGNDSITSFIGEDMYCVHQPMNSECTLWQDNYAGTEVDTFQHIKLESRPKALGIQAESNMSALDWVSTWKSTGVGIPVLKVFEDERVAYTITDRQGLYDFAFLVNDYEDFEGETIKLGADIVFNTGSASDYEAQPPKYTWIRPIGWKNYVPFKGTFDGQGHTISGLYMNSTDTYNGLFGSVKDATVKNLKITNSYITTTEIWTGSIVARGNGTFENLYSDAILKSSNAFIGGLFGQLDDGTIESEDGESTEPESTEPETVESEAVENSTLERCWFAGTITSTSSENDAGFVGGLIGYAAHQVNLTNCFHTGHIDITGTNNTEAGTGGFIGVSEKAVTIDNSVMLGTIKANDQNGFFAIVGKMGTRDLSGSNVYVAVEGRTDEQTDFQGRYPGTTIPGFEPVTVVHSAVLGYGAKITMPNLDWKNTWRTVDGKTPVLQWKTDN